jgi:hypothetical protein
LIPSKIGLERLMKVLLIGANGSSPKKVNAKGLDKKLVPTMRLHKASIVVP